jgi:ABC-2 type transport system permease protein
MSEAIQKGGDGAFRAAKGVEPLTEAVLVPPHAGQGADLTALWALFVLSLRQLVRGKRLLVLSALYLIPAVLALVLRCLDRPAPADDLETGLLFHLLPHALVPLTALLYAGSVIQDEVEDQTLTYLLIRPLPRWALYAVKLAAVWIVTVSLTVVFTTLTYAGAYWGAPELWGTVLPGKALILSGILAVALLAYCGVFGLIGVFTSRSLVTGVIYIVLFEVTVANADLVVRKLTVVYYVRVLSARWLDVNPANWNVNQLTAPGSLECIVTLVMVALVTTLVAMRRFSRGEFRVKTPEGS